ncbi:alpha/beta-hydrolase [Penicillium chermesinum]|nr:alpha/beta-hydrolase [Penicillium chermesinum]
MSDLTTLVLVHGSWHQPSCYNKIIKLLQPKLKCVAVALPSTANNPNATFKDDLEATNEAIAKETASGRNVVVVAHSYGGIPPASALPGCPFMDPFFGHPPPSWRVNKETGYADLVTPPKELFYHDVPDDEVEHWISELTTQSLKALFEGGEHTYEGWKEVPVWYIGTVEDRGLPVAAQRMGVGLARELGARVEHRELQTSHSPFLSQPEATVGIMLDALEDFTGQSVKDHEVTGERSAVIWAADGFWSHHRQIYYPVWMGSRALEVGILEALSSISACTLL